MALRRLFDIEYRRFDREMTGRGCLFAGKPIVLFRQLLPCYLGYPSCEDGMVGMLK